MPLVPWPDRRERLRRAMAAHSCARCRRFWDVGDVSQCLTYTSLARAWAAAVEFEQRTGVRLP